MWVGRLATRTPLLGRFNFVDPGFICLGGNHVDTVDAAQLFVGAAAALTGSSHGREGSCPLIESIPGASACESLEARFPDQLCATVRSGS